MTRLAISTLRSSLALLALGGALLGACSKEPRDLRRPGFLAQSQGGDLMVVDFQRSRVVSLSPAGGFVRAVGGKGFEPGELWNIWGLTALPSGGFAVINHGLSDPEDQKSFERVVKVFDATGAEARVFDLRPPGEQRVGWPEGIDVVPEGFVVGDNARDALLFFDREGRFLRQIDEIDGGPPLTTPSSPVYRGGKLWVAEYRLHRVRCITLDGRHVTAIGREGSGPGEFLFADTLDVSPERGWLVVGDLGNYRLQRFALDDGRFLEELVPQPARPGVKFQLSGVLIGADGLIYASDSIGNRVLVYRPGGELVRTIEELL